MLGKRADTAGHPGWRATVFASALLVSTALAATTAAPAAAAGHWAGTVGYASDNLLHGRSVSHGAPAWFGSIQRDNGRWIVGVQATGEHPQEQSRGAQIGLHVDRRWRVGEDWTAQIGLVHYESPRNEWATELRYNEASARLGWRGRLSVAFAHVPDLPWFDPSSGFRRGRASYVEAGFHQPLAGRLALDLGLGHADLRDVRPLRPRGLPLRDYRYASAGLRYGIGDVFLYATLIHANPPAADYFGNTEPRTRWVGALVWSF